jgi:hypothetical protein
MPRKKYSWPEEAIYSAIRALIKNKYLTPPKKRS